MAIEERVELSGGRDVERALEAIARALGDVTREQDKQSRSTKTLTEDQKKARAIVRERRRQMREQRRQLRALERQRQKNIRTLKSFVGGMTGAQFGATALGAAIIGLGTAAIRTSLEFGEVANQLAKTGRAFGLTADEVAVLEFQLGRLTNGNVNVSKALTAVVDAAGRAQQGMAQYQRVFDRLNIAVEDGNGQLRSAEDLFNDVRRALAGARTEQEALATASELFGRRMAAELVPALRATDSEVARLEQRYFGLAGALGDASEAAEAQEDALLDMKTAARGLRMEIGELLSPTITAGANALAEAMGRLREHMKEIAGGATASELAAQFKTITALGWEAASVQMEIEALQARSFRTGAQEIELAFLSRRAVRLREAVHLLDARNAAERDGAGSIEAANDAVGAGIPPRQERQEIEKKTLKVLNDQLQTEKELRLIVGGREADKAAEAERLRAQALEESTEAYRRMMEAQRAANEATVGGLDTVLSATSSLVSQFEKNGDSALSKVLDIGSTIVKTIQTIQAVTTTANAVASTQSSIATAKKTAELGVIATAAAPAATLASVAQGESSIAIIPAVVGAIIGGVASVVGIALAERGASEQFIRRQPPIDSKGHRMVGVMPGEKILDREATSAQAAMLTSAARFFEAQRGGGAPAGRGRGGSSTTIVNIGGRTVATLVMDAERDLDRFGTARGVA